MIEHISLTCLHQGVRVSDCPRWRTFVWLWEKNNASTDFGCSERVGQHSITTAI